MHPTQRRCPLRREDCRRPRHHPFEPLGRPELPENASTPLRDRARGTPESHLRTATVAASFPSRDAQSAPSGAAGLADAFSQEEAPAADWPALMFYLAIQRARPRVAQGPRNATLASARTRSRCSGIIGFVERLNAAQNRDLQPSTGRSILASRARGRRRRANRRPGTRRTGLPAGRRPRW